jgi:hypothetical protein
MPAYDPKGDCPGFDRAKVRQDVADLVGTATDVEWHVETGHGFCGGCGLDDCHPGWCCSEERDLMGVQGSVCGRCPERVRTGQIRTVTA